MREYAEKEARETYLVAVWPFGYTEELLLAWGKKYRLDNPEQILVRLKVKHSGFGIINNLSFGYKFVEETIPFRRRYSCDGQEVESKLHILRLLGQ